MIWNKNQVNAQPRLSSRVRSSSRHRDNSKRSKKGRIKLDAKELRRIKSLVPQATNKDGANLSSDHFFVIESDPAGFQAILKEHGIDEGKVSYEHEENMPAGERPEEEEKIMRVVPRGGERDKRRRFCRKYIGLRMVIEHDSDQE